MLHKLKGTWIVQQILYTDFSKSLNTVPVTTPMSIPTMTLIVSTKTKKSILIMVLLSLRLTVAHRKAFGQAEPPRRPPEARPALSGTAPDEALASEALPSACRLPADPEGLI